MKTKDERKRVALVDDDPKVLATLEAGLRERFNIVTKCASGEEALDMLLGLPADQRPQLVLLDIKMPGMGGIAYCGELRRLFPDLLIAMHTEQPTHEQFEAARLAGADAFLKKYLAVDQLADALGRLERRLGQCLWLAANDAGEWISLPPGLALLTPCELKVLELRAQRMREKEIAARLGKSVHTVKVQLASIRHKLGRVTTVEAAALWQQGNGQPPKRY